MKAVVMAGGFGTRIQPLTNSIPKPMLPILNIPMMEHIIIKLRDDLNIKDIVVLLYFKPEVIKDYFKNGENLGINITYVLPDDDYGTAGAVGKAREYLDETFIIVSGDLVTDFNLKEMENFHNEKKSKLTITLTSVEDPLQFGVVITNEEQKIEKFLEKPSWGEVFSDTINTGIYIIEPEILNYIPDGENFDFAKDLFPKLMRENISLWGHYATGYWRDVGNPLSYRDVYQDIFHKKIDVFIKAKKQDRNGFLFFAGDNITLPEKIKLKGTIILGNNVTIEEGVSLENVSIGSNILIKKHSDISNSVIWDNCSIGIKSSIKNAVICNNNSIGDKVASKFGVIIAEKCEIKNNVSIEKDITIWPDKIVNEGSVVSNSIIWGDKYKSSIFQNGKVIGRTNIELSPEMSAKLAQAFGSILPKRSKVYISRDYHKNSRMLKRAFLSGTLSTGIDVIDLENVSSNVMRHSLSTNDNVVAGIHLRQSIVNTMETEILFFSSEGLPIDTNLAKSVERAFFRENFRKVNFNETGEIYPRENIVEKYLSNIIKKINTESLQTKKVKIVTDIMFGSTSTIYPKIISELDIESIILNSYKDDKQLQNLPSLIAKSQIDIGKIVKALELDCGFLIYPNGQKVQFVCDNGILMRDWVALLVILKMIDNISKKRVKVLLPAWAPDFCEYENIDITRAKFSNLKAEQLQEYCLVANTDGGYSFSEFGLTSDALFTSFKFLDLLIKNNKKISTILKSINTFEFISTQIACSSLLKGKMMRKFAENSKGKNSSNADGVKIWISKNEWILMVPDEYSEQLNIYIQAQNSDNVEKILQEYKEKVEIWKNG